jgi:GINS complex subunit 2
MSIPQQNWTPEELSFLAEEETMIRITPQFTISKIDLISGNYGPFEAGRSVKVPLWLALFFNSNKSCVLVPPKWLTLSIVKQLLAREKESRDSLQKVPPCYMEVSFAFFNNANDVIKDADAVRSAIEDLWTIRTEKIRAIFAQYKESVDLFFTCPNMTRMELHHYREPITTIISMMSALYDKAQGLPPPE